MGSGCFGGGVRFFGSYLSVSFSTSDPIVN